MAHGADTPKGRMRRTASMVALASALCLVTVACPSSKPPTQIPSGAPGGEFNPNTVPGAKSPAPQVPTPLRTVGSKMVGPNGSTARFLGINVQGFQFSNDQGSSQPDACGQTWHNPVVSAATIAKLGFNSVRLPIAWANIEPQPPTKNSDGSYTHHWGEDYLRALDSYIESLRQQKIAVILDIAQFQWSSLFKGVNPQRGNCEGFGMPAWLNPNAANENINDVMCEFMSNRVESGVPISPWDGLSAVWKMLGQRYAKQPAIVAADTINEPFFVSPTCPGLDFNGMFKALGQAIRDVAPQWLLIFEYKPDMNQAYGITGPPPFDNRMYEIHVYSPDWNFAKGVMSSAYDQAKQWNMPMLVGEFDAFANAAIAGQDWASMTKDMLNWMRDHDVSWTLFPRAGGKKQAEAGVAQAQPLPELLRILQEGF